MMPFRCSILPLYSLVIGFLLNCQAAHASTPLVLSPDSAAQRIAQLHEKAVGLNNVLPTSEWAYIQSQAEIGRLHQTMNDLLTTQGWSLEEAMSQQGLNGKRAARIHHKQVQLLQRPAPRKWRKASGRETLLECCVVLSFYHEFTTTDGGQGQERIGLKVEEHEWAKLDSDNKRKSRILTIVASVSLVGITIVGLPVVLLVFGGGFVS